MEPARLAQALHRAKRRIATRTPGALDDGSPVGSQCRFGACPARAHHPKRAKSKRKQDPYRKRGPASSVPADRPDVALDFLANAVGRHIPRLVLVRHADAVPHVEAVGAGKITTKRSNSQLLERAPSARSARQKVQLERALEEDPPMLTVDPYRRRCRDKRRLCRRPSGISSSRLSPSLFPPSNSHRPLFFLKRVFWFFCFLGGRVSV